MARPAINSNKTTISIRRGLGGWLEFMGREDGITAYLNRLAEQDRARVMDEGGELAEKYRMYLAATDRDAELLQIEDELERRQALEVEA